MNRTLRRGMTAVAGTVVAALMLTGCVTALIPEESGAPSAPSSSATPGADTLPQATPDTDGVSEALMPYYAQTFEWTRCGDVYCADITAPMDWSDPSKGDLSLSIVRQLATGEARGSLLTNPGGPGASGNQLVAEYGKYVFSKDLASSYDIIGFDPRGVGDSTPVVCLDDAGMDDYLYGLVPGERGTDAYQAELDAKAKVFADACAASAGELLEFITTENSARDVDLIRALTGDTQLNYLGFSYGTFLGATYAKLFPSKAGRLVLDGAIDPSIKSLEVGGIQALGFESALRAYMQWCVDDTACPFTGTVEDGLADLTVLLQSLDAKPLDGADGRRLGADAMFTAIVSAMYSEYSWPTLATAIATAQEGDPATAFVLADSYNDRENGTYVSNSTNAFTAYNCMDYPVDYTEAESDALEARIRAEAPTIAPYWSGGDTCASWPYPPTGERGKITAEGTPPILVVGTTNDPATPYEWAVGLADQLASGVLLTRVGEGHTAYAQGNACIDSAVDRFLIDGTVPAEGTRCQ